MDGWMDGWGEKVVAEKRARTLYRKNNNNNNNKTTNPGCEKINRSCFRNDKIFISIIYDRKMGPTYLKHNALQQDHDKTCRICKVSILCMCQVGYDVVV